jgi:hypothetical protein
MTATVLPTLTSAAPFTSAKLTAASPTSLTSEAARQRPENDRPNAITDVTKHPARRLRKD